MIRYQYAILLAILTCCGCHFNIGGGPVFRESRTSVLEHVNGTAIEVESANGGITVTQSDRADVQIVAHLKAQTEERLQAARIIVSRNELDNLNVGVEWPGSRKGNEGCTFEIELPSAKDVYLRSTNGKLSVLGLSGVATLTTSNGSIQVDRFDGDIEAETSNGRVTVHDAEGKIDVQTRNGAIEIIEAKQDVIADTSNGSVKLKLADADSAGPIAIGTSNGSVTVELNSAFAGKLSCKTSNAKIRVDSISGTVTDNGKRSKVIQFGDSAVASRIKTSNGSINVRQR